MNSDTRAGSIFHLQDALIAQNFEIRKGPKNLYMQMPKQNKKNNRISMIIDGAIPRMKNEKPKVQRKMTKLSNH